MTHHSTLLAIRFAATALLLAGFILSGSAIPQKLQAALPQDLDGKPIDPFTSNGGRVVVLLLVRTDCPISNRYAPTIQRLQREFHGKVNFWLVYPDADESAAQIRAHDEEFHFSIPALRDVHRELVKRAHATIIPESAVFDSTGKLIYHGRIDNWYEDVARSRPAPTTHDLENAIRNTLDGKPTAPDHANAVGCYISDLK